MGYWQVSNCVVTASMWIMDASLELQNFVSALTWVNLKNVHPLLYSLDRISIIASGIDDPLHTEN